ncbi:uncharacterized protein TNIN_264121 [Trichonephila inaurata madagascariensis]|uniref:Uncharacterized protein n=1 Tax=Trichonephila inaurata madagascariensis TaxID=2747483 RepID=A0A8X6WYR7_9ARAC|nr:uncharacterized protein TNIN_264121 [Trichonephila inaurata madagascariensis]
MKGLNGLVIMRYDRKMSLTSTRKMTQTKRIMISCLINLLIWQPCFTLDDEDFDTFIAKTIMEDPWLNVNISEENTTAQTTLTQWPVTVPNNVQTEMFPGADIEVSLEDVRPSIKSINSSKESYQKSSIIILQNNCSDIKIHSINGSKKGASNHVNFTNIIEDCQHFLSVRISAQKSMNEITEEIRKAFQNFKIIKIITNVEKHEEVSIDLPSNLTNGSKFKSNYYIIGGIVGIFLLMLVVNFTICSRKNRKNHSMDLSEIPHLTLSAENFKMSIPRPTISAVHQHKHDENLFSDHYQRSSSSNRKYSQEFQTFENVEFKSKRLYLNPEDDIRFEEWMPKRQMHNTSHEKDFLGVDNSALSVKVVKY